MKFLFLLTFYLSFCTLVFSSNTVGEPLQKMEVRSPASREISLNRYARLLQDKVYANWRVPPDLEDIEEDLETGVVSFWVLHDGRILGTTVLKSTGEDTLDELALKAVENSKPFPKFPLDLKERNSLKVSIRFRYIPAR